MAKPLVEVAITADGSVFVREVDKSTEASKKFGDQIKKSDKATKDSAAGMKSYADRLRDATTTSAKFAAGVAAAGAALTAAMVKRGIESVDALNKISLSLGVAVADYQALGYAAKLAGVEQGALDGGLKKLAKSLTDAAAGSKQSAAAFGALKLNAAELLKLPADQQMARVADALNNVGNASQRAALAQKVFGKGGADLLPMLAQGSDGLAAMAREAELLGLNLSAVEVAQVDAAGDALDKIAAGTEGLSQQLAVQFAPIISDLAERFLGVTDSMGGVREIAADVFDAILTGVGFVGDAITGMQVAWLKFAELMQSGAAKIAAWTGQSEIAASMRDAAAKSRAQVDAILSKPLPSEAVKKYADETRAKFQAAAAATVAGQKTVQDALIDTAGATSAAAKEADKLAKQQEAGLKKLAAQVAGLENRAAALRMNERDQARLTAQIELTNTAVEAGIPITDEMRKKVDALVTANYDAEQAAQAHADALAKQKKETEENAKAADPWAEALTGAVERVDEAFADMWKNVGDGFDSFASGLKEAFKNLLAELAHLAITRPIVMKFASAMGLGGASSSAFGSTGGGGFDLGSLFSIGSGISKFAGGFANGGGFAGGLTAMFGNGGSLAGALQYGGASFYGGLGDLAANMGWTGASNAAYGQMYNYMGNTVGGNLMNLGTNLVAGYAGGLVGNYLGSNVLTDGRQAQGGEFTAIGGMIGSIWPGVGTAIGAAIGALVDVAFGTDNTKRVRLGITAGEYGAPSNLTESIRGASGLLLQSEHNRTDDNGEAAKEMMQSFLGIDETLTSISRALGIDVDFTNTKLVNPRFVGSSAVQDGFFGTALNNEMDAAGLKNASREFITAWLDQIKDELPTRVRDVVKTFSNATADELLKAFGVAAQLDKMLNLDVLEQVATTAEDSSRSILSFYDDATKKVVDLAAEYNGTADSLATLTDALAEQKAIAVQLAEQYRQIGIAVNETFGSSIAQIQDSLLSSEQLYAKRRDQIADLTTQLAATIDPTKIAQLSAQINDAALSAWNLLDESQRAALGQEFVAFLEDARELATAQITAGQDSLGSREDAVAAAIDLELLTQAANTQQQAANTFASAVASFEAAVAGGITLDPATLIAYMDRYAVEVNR